MKVGPQNLRVRLGKGFAALPDDDELPSVGRIARHSRDARKVSSAAHARRINAPVAPNVQTPHAPALSSAMSSRHDEYPPTDVGGNRSGSAQAGYRARARSGRQVVACPARLVRAHRVQRADNAQHLSWQINQGRGRRRGFHFAADGHAVPRGLLKTSQTTNSIAAFSLHERDTMQGAAKRVPDYQFETFMPCRRQKVGTV